MNEIKRGLQRLQEDGILSEGDANEVLRLILSRYVSNWGPNGSSDISGLLALRDDQPSASTAPVAPFSPAPSIPSASSAGFAGPPPSHATTAPGPIPSRLSRGLANGQEDLLGLYTEEQGPAPFLPNLTPAHSSMSELAGNPQDILTRSLADTNLRDNPGGQFMARDEHGNDYFDYDAFQASQAEQIGLVPKNKSKPSLPVVNYDSKQFADFSSSASSAPSSQPSSSCSSQIVATQDRSVIDQVHEQNRAKEQDHLTGLERPMQGGVLIARPQVPVKYKGQPRPPPGEQDHRSPIPAATGHITKSPSPPAKGPKLKSRPPKKKQPHKAGSGSQQDEPGGTRTDLGNASDTAGVAGNVEGEMPPSGSRPSDLAGEEDPLECYFWHEVGLCRKRHFCTYAHYPTSHGRVAPRPHFIKSRRIFRDSPNPGLRSDNWRQADTPPMSTPAATSVGTPTETPQPFDDQLGDQSVGKKLDELSLDTEN